MMPPVMTPVGNIKEGRFAPEKIEEKVFMTKVSLSTQQMSVERRLLEHIKIRPESQFGSL